MSDKCKGCGQFANVFELQMNGGYCDECYEDEVLDADLGELDGPDDFSGDGEDEDEELDGNFLYDESDEEAEECCSCSCSPYCDNDGSCCNCHSARD